MNPAPGKILFIAASGIGNTILATPMIQRARELWPQAQLDLLTSRKIFQAPLAHANVITNFFDLERSALSTLWHLRRRHYDVSINCFPSNRWQYNVVGGTIGATQRITHSYFDGNHMAWLMNSKIPADESLHDVEQNLRSLNAIDANIDDLVPPPVIFALRDEHGQRAGEWLKNERLESRRLVGLHVARGKPTGNHWLMNRRLGAMNSPRAEDLRRDIAERAADSAIIFFGSAEEEDAIANFRKQLPEETQSRSYRYCSDLWTTAALIHKCHYFISGDTVLMHIAAVFQIPQKAYFMSTNPRRTAPRNPKAELVVENSTAYRYPFSLR